MDDLINKEILKYEGFIVPSGCYAAHLFIKDKLMINMHYENETYDLYTKRNVKEDLIKLLCSKYEILASEPDILKLKCNSCNESYLEAILDSLTTEEYFDTSGKDEIMNISGCSEHDNTMIEHHLDTKTSEIHDNDHDISTDSDDHQLNAINVCNHKDVIITIKPYKDIRTKYEVSDVIIQMQKFIDLVIEEMAAISITREYCPKEIEDEIECCTKKLGELSILHETLKFINKL